MMAQLGMTWIRSVACSSGTASRAYSRPTPILRICRKASTLSIQTLLRCPGRTGQRSPGCLPMWYSMTASTESRPPCSQKCCYRSLGTALMYDSESKSQTAVKDASHFSRASQNSESPHARSICELFLGHNSQKRRPSSHAHYERFIRGPAGATSHHVRLHPPYGDNAYLSSEPSRSASSSSFRSQWVYRHSECAVGGRTKRGRVSRGGVGGGGSREGARPAVFRNTG